MFLVLFNAIQLIYGNPFYVCVCLEDEMYVYIVCTLYIINVEKGQVWEFGCS